jgi:hypothetical protein
VPQEKKPYPAKEMQEAKSLRDNGALLLREAMEAETQEEKNNLAAEAKDRYFFPAQDILERLRNEYPEHQSQIDSLYQVVNQDIMDAMKITGTGG